MVCLDAQGRVTSWNKAAEQLLGWTEAETLGRELPYIPVGSELESDELWRRVMQGEESLGTEIRRVRKDGRPVDLQLWTTIIRDKAGALVGTLGLLADITQQKQAAAEKRTSEQRLRSLIDAEPECVKVTSTDGVLLDMNPAGLAMIEADSLEQVRGRSVLPIVAPEHREAFASFTQRAADGTPGMLQFEIVGLKGTRRWMETRAVPFGKEAGGPTTVLAITHDITHRKQTEESLRLFSALLDHVRDSIEIIDPRTGRFVGGNEQAWENLGYTRNELLALTVPDIDPVVTSTIFADLMRRLRESGTAVVLESVHRRKDGTTFPVEVSAQLIRHDRNNEYLVAIVRDITDRKRAEKLLARSRDFYLSILQDFPAMIWRSGVDAKCDYFNNTWLTFTGRTLEQELGDGWAEGVHPDDVDRCLARYLKAFHAREPFILEYRLRRYDGEYRTIFDHGSPFHDMEGNFTGFIGACFDITDRKQVQDRLQQSEEQYRGLVDTMQEGLGVQDKHGLITYVNQRLCEMLGYAREELLGKPAAFLFDEENQKILHEQMERRRAGERQSFEIAWRRKDGGRVDTIIAPNPRFDRNGNFVESAAVITDITERKRLEEELRQAQKMEAIGRLAGGIAHDFNNLLTIILGQSDRLLKGLAPREPIRKTIEEIKNAGERAASLITQLLAFSRKQVLQPKTLALNDLVTNMEGLLRRLIGEHITLTVRLDPALGHVKADPGQLEQVVMNLVLNARDAMPRGGTITLATKPLDLHEEDAAAQASPGRYASLVVSDTGQGMDAATQARIFEPFFTTKVLGRGTGLGLSMVYGIVTQSGGFISVLSQPGCGATFTICLPQADEVKDSATALPPAPAPPGSGETILLVEDEPDVREFVRETLEDAGYRVLAAQDGVEALALAGRHPACTFLLTDVVMPRMGGRELAERLEVQRPSLQVLYMSGYTDEVLLPHGVQAFIQKPFSAEELIEKVRISLERAR